MGEVFVGRRWLQPEFVVCYILVVVAVWLGDTLLNPGLSHPDEFLTYVRTKNLLETGDFLTVTVGGLPSWEKPPLQYWGGALLLSLGFSPVFSLRFLPYLFALLTLGLTALTAKHLSPNNRWAMPFAVILTTLSQLFIKHSRLALLETGLCFFILLSVYSLWRAQENRNWWFLWGLSCGLGAMQKVPIAWIVSVIVALPFLVFRRERFKRSMVSGSFALAALMGLALTLAWPLVQAYRWGGAYWDKVHFETFQRVAQGIHEVEGSGMGFQLDRVLFYTYDAAVFWVLAGLSVLFALGRKLLKDDLKQQGVLLCWLVLTLGLTISAGPVYPRYILVILPLMSVVTAANLARVWPSPWPIFLVLAVCWAYQAPRLAMVPYHHLDWIRCDLYFAAQRFDRVLDTREVGLTFVKLNDSPVLPFLDYRTRVRRVHSLEELSPDETYTMFTETSLLSSLRERFETFEVLFTYGDFVVVRLNPRRLRPVAQPRPKASQTHNSP